MNSLREAMNAILGRLRLPAVAITLRQYGIEIIERLLCYDSLSLILLWTFMKAFGIVCCYIFNDGNYTMSTLNLIQDLGLLIVFVDAQ